MKSVITRFTWVFVILFFFSPAYTSGMAKAAVIPINPVDSSTIQVQADTPIQNDPSLLLALAAQGLQQGSVNGLLGLTEKILVLQPDNYDALSYRALALAVTGNFDQTEATLRKAKNLRETPGAIALCAQAIIARQQKSYEKAVALANKATTILPDHPYPLNVLGRIYFDQDDLAEATQLFKQALALEPKFLPALINLGSSQYLAGNLNSAKNYFTNALSIAPNDPVVHLNLSIVYETAGRFEQAAVHLQQNYTVTKNMEQLPRIGNLQLKAGLYSQVLETAEIMEKQGIELSPVTQAEAKLHLGQLDDVLTQCQNLQTTDANMDYTCGFAFMLKGDDQAALTSMDKALEKAKNHLGAYAAGMVLREKSGKQSQLFSTNVELPETATRLLSYLAGNISFSHNKLTEAMKYWDAAEGFIPGFSITGIHAENLQQGFSNQEVNHINLGVLYYLGNFTAEAQIEFDKALAINPDSIFAHYWNAQIDLKQGNKAQTINEYKNAVKSAPDFFAALYAIGELSFVTGDSQQAVEFYKRALKVKKTTGVLLKLGMFSEYQRNYDDAANYYQKVIDTSPDFFAGYNQLAWLYAKQGIHLDKAMKLAEHAEKLIPGNASILDTIGWIHYQQGNYQKALQTIEHSLDVKPANPTVLYHLGEVQLALGMDDKAHDSFQAALKSPLPFEERPIVQEKLQQQ